MNSVSWEEYVSIKKMNVSTLVHGCHSMRRLKRYIDGHRKETQEMVLGVAMHSLTLEPDQFEERHCKMPDFHLEPGNVTAKGEQTESKLTKYYKSRVAEFAANNAGKSIIGQHQYDSLLYAIESLRSRPRIASIIDSCEKEVTFEESVLGVPFKGRMDLVKKGLIVDLKTTANCHKFAFGRVFVNQRYDFKMSIYRELYRAKYQEDCEVGIICVEIGNDFDCCYVPIPGIVLDNAMDRVVRVLCEYQKCVESGEWPGVDGGADEYELAIPNWSMEDEEESVDWQELPNEANQEIAEVPF